MDPPQEVEVDHEVEVDSNGNLLKMCSEFQMLAHVSPRDGSMSHTEITGKCEETTMAALIARRIAAHFESAVVEKEHGTPNLTFSQEFQTGQNQWRRDITADLDRIMASCEVKEEAQKTKSLEQQDRYRKSELEKSRIDMSRYLPITILINCRRGYKDLPGWQSFKADAAIRGHHVIV